MKKFKLTFSAAIEGVVEEEQLIQPLPSQEQVIHDVTEVLSESVREGETLTVSNVALVITNAKEEES